MKLLFYSDIINLSDKPEKREDNFMRTPQEIRDNILDLLKKRKSSVNKMLIECGYNTSLVNDLKKGQMPSADKIVNIAKYLGVSTDYLMGSEDDFNSENDLITALRRAFYGTSEHKLSEYDKKHIIELAEMITKIKLSENHETDNKNNRIL